MSVFNSGSNNSALSGFSSNSKGYTRDNLQNISPLINNNNNYAHFTSQNIQKPSENTFRVNPMAFSSLQNLDVDKLEEDLAKELQRKKISEERERRNVNKLFEENKDIQELKSRIKLANLNQERSKQIYERQTRKLQGIVKDAEVDEQLLEGLEAEKMRTQEIEYSKKMEKIHGKYVLQKQMKDKEMLREESKQEYLRDKQLVDDVVQKLMNEDMNALNENHRKKNLAKNYMDQAYDQKERRKVQQKEDEKLQKEMEKQYLEQLAKRDRELKEKKAAIQGEKDKIFDKLSGDAERKQAEKEYWENVRNELTWEEMNRREKIKELQEAEKKQR